jgi:ribonuclease R
MLDKNSIIRYLRERAQRPVRLKEIARGLGVDAREYRRLKRLLRQMEEAGEIYRVRRRRYALPDRINLVVGRLQVIRAGHGFVIPEDGSDDVFVASSQLKDAYDGDQVVARIERRRRGRNPEGTIVRVLERARSKVVGVYHRSGRYSYLAPLENALHRDVFIPPKAGGEAGDGFIVVARIVDWGSDHHDPVGEVVEILGRPGEPGVDVLAIIHSHELPAEFRRDALDEAEKLRAEFDAPTALAGRTDFRGTLTFTIDPADASPIAGASASTSPTSHTSSARARASTRRRATEAPACTWSIAYCQCCRSRSRETSVR